MKDFLDKIVTALVGKNMVDDWWNRPNVAFDMYTPADMYEINPDRVASYLYAQLNGDYL